jgi:hypothetical protein
LIEQICTSRFIETVGDAFSSENLVLSAAGRIIYRFESEESCARIVHNFHARILEEVPGILLSQAVIPLQQALRLADIQLLEEYLSIQRNKSTATHGLGWMAFERSRRTGAPAITRTDPWTRKEDYLDRNQHGKRKYHEEDKNSIFTKLLTGIEAPPDKQTFATEVEQLLDDPENNWVAIVHADGNNLGKTIAAVMQKVELAAGSLEQFLPQISQQINAATVAAAADAFRSAILPVFQAESENKPHARLPLRPVLLGGDDLTFIIRGNLAFHFTEVYLRRFEYHTTVKLGTLAHDFKVPELKSGLTACAGIAYIKSKYPFHYGVDLANSLCEQAKRRAKALVGTTDRVPSGLMFHRVLSAFVDENFETLAERELSTQSGVAYDYGPYLLQNQGNLTSIAQLRKWVQAITEDKAPRAPLREWLTELDDNTQSADQLMERIRSIHPAYITRLELDRPIDPQRKKTHLYDVITLSSIENQ